MMRFGCENALERFSETSRASRNVLKFHSKLEEFRVNERYTDVTITCEETNFKCHRVALATASEYFHAMFGGSFRESTEENVVLKETSAKIFEEIVQFIYTGDVVINPSNVYGLLQASDFLKLTGLQDICVLFIRENRISVENTFDVFTFACATKMKSLIDLLSLDIVTQFRIFSRNERFLEISFDDLNIILDKWKSLSVRNEEVLVGALIRWISHARESRSQYIEKLLREVRFENLTSGEYTRFIFIQLLTNLDTAELTRFVKPVVDYDEVPSPMARKSVAVHLQNQKSLNVYIQFPKEDSTRVFSIRNENECSICGDEVFRPHNNNQCIRSVAFDDDHLYCIHYPRKFPEYLDTDEYNQTFRMYNSVSLCSGVELKNPPVIFKDVNLVHVRNTIYACGKSLFQCTTSKEMSSTSRSSVIFNDEEVKRGTYVYHCDVDTWMPIPAMGKKFYTCCATTRDGILYLFGNENPYEPNAAKSSIQIRAYDYRMGVWSNLTPGNFDNSTRTECCVSDNALDDRIILQTGPRAMTSYNIKAGRWEPMSRAFQMNKSVQYRRLVSYSNRVWAIGGSIEDEPSDLSFEFAQDTSTLWSAPLPPNHSLPFIITPTPWFSSTALTQTAEKFVNTSTGIVLDAVVFRSP